MKSIFRTIGSFLYTIVICVVFMIISALILPRAIDYAEGFWKSVIAAFGTLFLFAWLAEKGIALLSIPYNWLWDRTKKTRKSTMAAAVIVGILCLLLPFRLNLHLDNAGGWVVLIIWELSALFFFYNMFTLPIINTNMGRE